jgi:hypothetical protein
MKQCISLILVALSCGNAFSQDFAVLKKSKDKATTTNEVPNKLDTHFEVSNCSSTLPTNTAAIKLTVANYTKLWMATSHDQKTVKLCSNFEGKVLLQYIITNSNGQVMQSQETTLSNGTQTLDIALHQYSDGNYFITAKVISKETKAQSNYTFKVVKE